MTDQTHQPGRVATLTEGGGPVDPYQGRLPEWQGRTAARRVGGRGWVAAEPLFGLREDAAGLIQLTSVGEFTAVPLSTLDGLRDLAQLLHHRDPSPVLVETVGAESELDVPSGLLSCGQTEVGHRCGQLSALPWGRACRASVWAP
jgi:hypothetical protein